MLIVNQTGDTIYNMAYIDRIARDGCQISVNENPFNEKIYEGENAAVMFEAIIEAASTGAQVIRLDKE